MLMWCYHDYGSMMINITCFSDFTMFTEVKDWYLSLIIISDTCNLVLGDVEIMLSVCPARSVWAAPVWLLSVESVPQAGDGERFAGVHQYPAGTSNLAVFIRWVLAIGYRNQHWEHSSHIRLFLSSVFMTVPDIQLCHAPRWPYPYHFSAILSPLISSDSVEISHIFHYTH